MVFENMFKNIIFSLLAVVVFPACESSSNQLLSAEQAVKLRHMQTRAFDTQDINKSTRVVMATLQDLEFVIENADAELGIVNATKLDGYQLKMTVTIRPYGKNEEQLLIRASAQHGLRALTDPEPYQNFFTSLSKALFLEAQEVK